MFNHGDGHRELGFWWWVVLVIGLCKPAELYDTLAAAINFRRVGESCQLDGLANGTDCAVHQLRSNSVAVSKVAVPDPDSKHGEDVGFLEC